MIRSRMVWAVATNQSRSVAELASLPTTSASLARTALLNSARSSSLSELVDDGMDFERLRPGFAMACAYMVLAFSSQRRLTTIATSLDTQHYCKTYAGLHMPNCINAGRPVIFPQEFTWKHWPRNSFAALMFWAGARGKSLAGVT